MEVGRRVLPLVLLLGLVVSSINTEAGAVVPDPVTCQGYAENRIYLENQSWHEPQPPPFTGTHPGTGKQGHIHVATCFPLYQTVTSDTLALDIRVQLHNVTGDLLNLVTRTYQMGGPGNGFSRVIQLDRAPHEWTCSSVDCERWFHIDFPLSQVPESGWAEFHIMVNVQQPGGTFTDWYNVNRWFFKVANGQPPRPDPPVNIRIGGNTWLVADAPGQTDYSEVRFRDASFPWDFSTGQTIPVSGIWRPAVWFKHTGHATIDPSLHAVPPNPGTVVYHGLGGDRTLTIDTTQLSNGPHKLLLASCDERASGTDNCGVLVAPFTVAN